MSRKNQGKTRRLKIRESDGGKTPKCSGKNVGGLKTQREREI